MRNTWNTKIRICKVNNMTWEDIMKRQFGPLEDERTKEARTKSIERRRKQEQEKDSQIASKTKSLFAKLGRQIDKLTIDSKSKEDLDEFLDDLQELLEMTAKHYELHYDPRDLTDSGMTLRNFLADNSRKVSSKLDRFRRGE